MGCPFPYGLFLSWLYILDRNSLLETCNANVLSLSLVCLWRILIMPFGEQKFLKKSGLLIFSFVINAACILCKKISHSTRSSRYFHVIFQKIYFLFFTQLSFMFGVRQGALNFLSFVFSFPIHNKEEVLPLRLPVFSSKALGVLMNE